MIVTFFNFHTPRNEHFSFLDTFFLASVKIYLINHKQQEVTGIFL